MMRSEEEVRMREALERIAELAGDCDHQQFALTRFQASQIARAALCPCRPVTPPQPFRDVRFCKMLTPQEVADHEVLMAFLKDSDAILFAEWWHHSGAVAFQKYLDAVEEQGR